tara:strand:- start:802 stop:1791 length:990 start_codon:yes stop_codon:yes gene_type:complete
MKKDEYYIIGVDGGASKSRGILMNSSGDTLATAFNKGSNLTVYGKLAAERIIHIINDLCEHAHISIDLIDSVGLGIAGASNEEGRDQVFKALDALNLSKKSLVANDAEVAYELNCPGTFGILVTVGTGVICLARDNQKEMVRVAGNGHDNGDVGSGYWIGKQAILNLSLNESSVIGDADLEEIMNTFLYINRGNSFEEALHKIQAHPDYIRKVAALTNPLIKLAEDGNNVALSIIQEASHAIANYVISVTEKLKFHDNNIVLAGNGSVIRNDYFRKSINDELKFHFKDVKWTFSTISPAYGAGIMAAKLFNDLDIRVSDILKGDALAAT